MKAGRCLVLPFILLFLWPVISYANIVGIENLSTSETGLANPIGDLPGENDGPRIGYNQASAFRTGSNGGSYALSSVTLHLATTSHGGGGFSVSIFSNDASHVAGGAPLAELAVLTGITNPIGAGYFTFLATNPFPLSASTTYWVLASVPHDGSVDSLYYWFSATTINEEGLDGWSIPNQSRPRSFDDGVPSPVWGVGPSNRFSVGVVAIPECSAVLHATVGVLVAVPVFIARRAAALLRQRSHTA